MINAASFLEIMIKRLIEEAHKMKVGATDELAKKQTMGHCLPISKIVDIAEEHNLLDSLPVHLRDSINEFLVELEFTKISEQQLQTKSVFKKNGYNVVVGGPTNYKEVVVFVILNGEHIALLQKEDGPDKIRIEFHGDQINTTASYEVFLEALQAAKEELLK